MSLAELEGQVEEEGEVEHHVPVPQEQQLVQQVPNNANQVNECCPASKYEGPLGYCIISVLVLALITLLIVSSFAIHDIIWMKGLHKTTCLNASEPVLYRDTTLDIAKGSMSVYYKASDPYSSVHYLGRAILHYPQINYRLDRKSVIDVYDWFVKVVKLSGMGEFDCYVDINPYDSPDNDNIIDGVLETRFYEGWHIAIIMSTIFVGALCIFGTIALYQKYKHKR